MFFTEQVSPWRRPLSKHIPAVITSSLKAPRSRHTLNAGVELFHLAFKGKKNCVARKALRQRFNFDFQFAPVRRPSTCFRWYINMNLKKKQKHTDVSECNVYK